MPKIINLRGTSGSGKSTVAKTFIDNHPHSEVRDPNTNKVIGYKVDASAVGLTKPVFIVGRYDTACGGGDTLKDEEDAVHKCETAQQYGHVLMERMLTSGSGPKGKFASSFAGTGKIVYAILDTPLETCLERVMKRRESRGETKPFNPENTINKYRQTRRAASMLYDAEEDVRSIDHTNAFQQVVDIMKESDND